ncbi:3-phosphoshikimate 1-carboxyvinyltransferase [Catenulispora sp. NL8]|uniref:3-phosphoshikimate 1-carboxyvinyltransferase n=1 Tax=Catenulispora pinistramenti TaxID=2705254 RepID=A0ABS5L3N6_9ACTN|nr:3-phosphoshikimate 1-carboxyvinyltransferase [Catenulispora pinistramenti]MBS2552931.1 3-phosphoshikimate 1-carboxyvinyltransferase [Catenulispora pinistramenti]
MTSAEKTLWSAPPASRPVTANVRVPGSKSATNRALLLAALADSASTVTGGLRARDSVLMVGGLRALGVKIEAGAELEAPVWRVTPPERLHGGDVGDVAKVDVGLAGTVMRFLPPVAALADGPVYFDGDPYARSRPMGTLLQSLRDLGVRIDDGDRGTFPFLVEGTGSVPGGLVELDATASSQFISALLLAGSRYERGVEVRHVGGPIPSQPHIDMTVEFVRAAGGTVDATEPGRWVVTPSVLRGREWSIEPDLSNSAPFLAAALVTGGTVTVADWPARTTQAGDALRHLLREMGARVELTTAGLTVSGGAGVHGMEADLHDVGELTPILAAIAALADSPSRFTGIGHLRGHETDRLAALAREINGLGGDVVEEPDGLLIRPVPLHGGVFGTYADHRLATAGALLGLAVPGVEVEDIATTGKTLPDFPAMWAAMLTADDHEAPAPTGARS